MPESIVTKLRKPNLPGRIKNRIRSFFYIQQWVLLLAHKNLDKQPSWSDFNFITPPLDRIWADPFIWIHENKYFIFFEEKFTEKYGHISCIELDNDFNILSNEIVLERPYHLSYPFIFEHDGELYMIPESGMNRAVEVYRCTKFPNQWELVRTLLSGIYAVDATLFENMGKWWLFVNIAREGGNTVDTLFLFYSDHPLSEHWIPHPENPIVQDIRSARSAGRIFFRDGNIIRPSQDSSKRYGYALNFNRIIELTETSYTEVQESTFKPPSFSNIIATHTWNEVGGLRSIDAKLWRWKFQI